MSSQWSTATAVESDAPRPEAPVLALEKQRALFRVILLVTDWVAVAFVFRASYWVRFDLGITVSPEVVPEPFQYPLLFALLMPLFLGTFALSGLYNSQVLLGGVQEYSKVFTACTAATMVAVIVAFMKPELVMSRMWLITAWLLTFLMVSLSRFACRRLAYAARKRGFLLAPAVIVGDNQEALALSEELRDARASGLRVVGFVTGGGSELIGRHIEGLPVLGRVSNIARIISDYSIEDVVVAITALKREELLRLCEDVNGIRGAYLRLSSGLYELITTGVSVTSRGSVPLVTINKARLERQQAFVKAVLDYAVAVFAVVLLSPCFLIVAVIVRLDSPGPVFHRRRVMGVCGSQFDAFKFRTMCVDGDALLKTRPEVAAELRSNHKVKQDPRITSSGRWLRKFSIDELPQLFNVLRGQMSLVGPRMITAEETEKYGKHRLNLLTVKPGLTGLWQVNGRSDVTYEERIKLDMYYVRNYSVWMDFQILFVQTIPAVIRGRGAY